MKELVIYVLLFGFLSSCEDKIVEENSYENTFTSFWTIMDEHYVYFDEKKLNWDSIYIFYKPIAKTINNDNELASLFYKIINSWTDNHVSFFKTSGSWLCSEPIAKNKNWSQYPPIKLYGFSDYIYKVGWFHTAEHIEKNYGYLNINSLNEGFPIKLLKEAISIYLLRFYNGIIIDLRSCDGGYLSSVINVSNLFYSGNKILFYEQNKTGKGRNDFGKLKPFFGEGSGNIPEEIPMIVLIDSANYSAVNLLAFILNELPNSISVGTTTSGGGGPVKSVDLPNGWILNYPYLKFFSVNGENMEYGLHPDVFHYFYPPKDYNGEYDEHVAIALELLDSINDFERTNYLDMHKN
jgi:hypothetical protein